MKPVHVTEPFLPPLEEYTRLLGEIWERGWVTNHGPVLQQLERGLAEHLELDSRVICIANGGLGLQIALKALGVRGEVVTTPFSYIATASCPLWDGCSVKYADIDEETLTLDVAAVESTITADTEAILATHVFGNPCDVEAFRDLGEKHGIPVVYDAAHAFGVRYAGESVLRWGNASMVSTHATKFFNTIEGGFVCSMNPEIEKKMEWMRRFGHDGPYEFHGVGLNAKLSELHAAVGILNLQRIQSIIEVRKKATELYDELLAGSDSVAFAMTIREGAEWNYAYYPVLYRSEAELVQAIERFGKVGIYPRRYFWPTLERALGTGDGSDTPIAKDVSDRILCLPLSASITNETIERVVSLVD
ncbi:MAG: DegT/DnrJ/EryC1/StrS family aminotransferase [Verrucomicrobiota bacterium]